jgi:cytosine/creatinine deaminase
MAAFDRSRPLRSGVVNRAVPPHDSPFDLILRRCRIEGRVGTVDIAVAGPWIAATGSPLVGEAVEEIDAGGRLASPSFVQPHIHLDKVLAGWLIGPNQSGTLAEAIDLLHQTKRSSSVDDVARRAGQVIRAAVLSGTTFIRSHVDVDTIGGLTPLRGVLQAAREHADLCQLEVVAFPQEGLLRDPGAADLMAQAMEGGAGVVGGMPHWERDAGDARRHVEQCLDLAERHDADVDMHIDETDDPASHTFEMLLDATERHGWQGRVTAGHCCAMAAWDAGYRDAMIGRAAALNVSVVTNPATNLLLQGRLDPPPQRRGLPPVKALIEGGVRVACGQDCVADAFYPFGAGSQLQSALILCHAAQLSTVEEIGSALAAVRHQAAALVGLDRYGLEPGCRADLIVLDADDAFEALRIQAATRWVLHRGKVVAETSTETTLHRQPTLQETVRP